MDSALRFMCIDVTLRASSDLGRRSIFVGGDCHRHKEFDGVTGQADLVDPG